MPRVLVTGGLGFIGSNLVHELDRLGYNVDIIDDMSTGIMENLLNLEFRCVNADMLHLYVRDYEQNDTKKHLVILGDFIHHNICDRIMSGIYDYVFHLAGNSSSIHSIDNPTLSAEINFLKTVELFRISAKSDLKRLIFSSTSDVYGDASQRPTPETIFCNPKTPYGLHKLQCEQSIKLYKNLYGLNAVSLRYFSVYGPRQLGNCEHVTGISSWCHALRTGKYLKVSGDGTQTRDMIHVNDVVNANIKAALCTKDIAGHEFNIASGQAVSDEWLLQQFVSHFGDAVRTDNIAWRPGNIMHTQADINKSRDVLDFKVSINLKDGLNGTWEWWNTVPDYLLNFDY